MLWSSSVAVNLYAKNRFSTEKNGHGKSAVIVDLRTWANDEKQYMAPVINVAFQFGTAGWPRLESLECSSARSYGTISVIQYNYRVWHITCENMSERELNSMF